VLRQFELIGLMEAFLTFAFFVYATWQVGMDASVKWAMIQGFLLGRMGFLMHTGLHCAQSTSPFLNKLVGTCMDLAGGNSTVWTFEHQVAHHMDPNFLGKDNDCKIGDPLLRLHPELPTGTDGRWWLPYQHIITIVGMSSGFFKWYLYDFYNLYTGIVGSVSFVATAHDLRRLWLFKMSWLLFHFVWPWYFHGAWTAGLMIIIKMVIGAQYLENTFIVNHIQDGLVPKNQKAHWANRQLEGSANWASGSLFWNWWSGGLNHQIEHHLFPSIHIYAYPMMSKVVQDTAKEFGLPYNNFKNFGVAWWSMLMYLRKLGVEGLPVPTH